MSSKQKFTAEEVTQALKDTKGMVYLAAQRLGCEAKTIYNYRDRYASVRAEMEQQDGMVNDIAEMKLYQAIMDGEQWAVVFRLKTKAKDRGYTERTETEISGRDGGDIVIKAVDYRNGLAAIAATSDDGFTDSEK